MFNQASIANRAPQKLFLGGAMEAWGRSQLVGPPGKGHTSLPKIGRGGHELPAVPGPVLFFS